MKEILKNQQYGYLTTIEYINDRTPKVWKCKCTCGKICYVTPTNLRNEKVKSCGCKRYVGLKKNTKVTKDPYYRKWQYHKQKGNNPFFNNIEDFKSWYQQMEKNGNKITIKLKDQWRNCISKNQNGDFKSLEDYCNWAYGKGYINEIHTLHKKDKNKPHSKKNTDFGFFYEKKFISIYICKKNNFKYDRNKKLFYGYIKYKGTNFNTKKCRTFQEMLIEYKEIYEFLKNENFEFT